MKKHQPLFAKEELIRWDSVQEKRKKVAKMLFEWEMRRLESEIYKSWDVWDAIEAFDKFRARIRRIVKRF